MVRCRESRKLKQIIILCDVLVNTPYSVYILCRRKKYCWIFLNSANINRSAENSIINSLSLPFSLTHTLVDVGRAATSNSAVIVGFVLYTLANMSNVLHPHRKFYNGTSTGGYFLLDFI